MIKDSFGIASTSATTICTLDARSSCSLVNSRLMMSTQSTRSLYKHFQKQILTILKTVILSCASLNLMCSCLCNGGGMCGCVSVLSQSGDDCHAMTTPKSSQRRLFLLINFRRTSVHVKFASVWVSTRLGLGPVILYPLSVLKTNCMPCVAGHTAPVDVLAIVVAVSVVVTACSRRHLPLSTSAI